jgi:hypothetical protein
MAGYSTVVRISKSSLSLNGPFNNGKCPDIGRSLYYSFLNGSMLSDYQSRNWMVKNKMPSKWLYIFQKRVWNLNDRTVWTWHSITGPFDYLNWKIMVIKLFRYSDVQFSDGLTIWNLDQFSDAIWIPDQFSNGWNKMATKNDLTFANLTGNQVATEDWFGFQIV